MKKIVLLLVCLMGIALVPTKSVQVQAQQNVIKLNPLSLILGEVSLSYERVLTEKTSVVGGVGLRSLKLGDYKYSGFSVLGEYRFYITTSAKDIPRGFYAAPFLKFAKVKQKWNGSGGGFTADEEWNFSRIVFGGIVGYQWLFNDLVALDLFLGPNYGISTFDADGISENRANSSGIGVRFGASIGIAF